MAQEHAYLQNVTPIIAQWDITSGCNFRCSFCLTASSSPSKDELTTSQACRLLDKLDAAGIVFLRVLGGEPFFRKDMVEILQYASRKGMVLAFSTNASLIDERVAASLAGIGHSIRYLQVSLYGSSPEVYRQVTGNPDGYRLVERGLQLLTRHGLDFTVLTVATDENVESLPEYYDVAAQNSAEEFRICSKVCLGRAADHPLAKSDDTWTTLLAVLGELKKKEERLGVPIRMEGRPLLGTFVERQTGIRYFFENCTAAKTMVHIDARGWSRPCPFLEFLPPEMKDKYGHLSPVDLVNLPFDQVWESPTFNAFREYFHPDTNPNPYNLKCPHFKDRMCVPCPITPCTCPEIIRGIKARSGKGERQVLSADLEGRSVLT